MDGSQSCHTEDVQILLHPPASSELQIPVHSFKNHMKIIVDVYYITNCIGKVSENATSNLELYIHKLMFQLRNRIMLIF